MKVCMVLHKNPNNGGAGAERQLYNIGKGLEKKHDVDFLECSNLKINPLNQYKLDWSLKRIDADVYVQTCAGTMTYYVGKWCRKNNKKFVFRASSLNDSEMRVATDNRPKWKTTLADVFYRHGIYFADRIVCLTQEMLNNFRQRGFGNTVQIYSGVNYFKLGKKTKEPYFIWVGRHVPKKRLWLADKLQGLVKKDIHYLTGSSHRRVMKEIGRAWGLVSTAVNEGLPNTWMEAWSRGTPVFSIGHNPDNLSVHHFSTIEMLAKQINEFEYSPVVGKAYLRYARRFFDMKKTVRNWEKVLEQCVG